MATQHQTNTLTEIESAVSFFLKYDCRDDITFSQVLDKAGVEYPVFYSVINMLKKNREFFLLRRLAARLKEINVLKNVKILGDLPEDEEAPAYTVDTESEERHVTLPGGMQIKIEDRVDDSLDIVAWQKIVEALKPLSPKHRERVMFSAQGFYGIGVG